MQSNRDGSSQATAPRPALRIGVVSHLFPTRKRPAFGHFVKEQLDWLAREAEIRLYAPMLSSVALEGDPYRQGDLPYPAARPFEPAFPRWFLHRRNPSLMAFFLRRHRALFEGCRLIHAHTAFPAAGAAVRVFGGALPVVVTVHGSDIDDFAYRPDLAEGIREDLNRAACIIAVSESLAAKLPSLGVATPVRVIPNGVDTARFTPGDKKAASGRIGLDPGRPRILFAGNFNRVKNAEQLIRIMPRVLERFPRCELALVGAVSGNPFVARYRRMVSEQGLDGCVSIHAMRRHEELPDWYRACDVFALPSLREGFGLVLAEALACGRPVVAARSGGPERIVEPGTGFLVPVSDDGELASAVLRVLSGEGVGEPSMLADSARRRFSYEEVVIPALMETYRDVLNRGRVVS